MADPLGVVIKPFIPLTVVPGEAKELLVTALDWHSTRKAEADVEKSHAAPVVSSKSSSKKSYSVLDLDKSRVVHPPSIDLILKGLTDGRKRALFIIINYFRSLGYSSEEVTNIVDEWNKRNKKPLLGGYITTQISWSYNQKKLLPPNYDKPHYKGIGITPTSDELKFKNPVNYAVKKYFEGLRGKGGKNISKNS